MKNIFTFLLCAITSIAFGQITCISYQLTYDNETNQYDVNLLILKGSKNTILERAQFNTQVSIIAPIGQAVALTDMNMPLQNNQSYDSTIPAKWSLWNQVNAQQSNPTSTFYSVAAVLSP
jgi:hypothetical protein